MPTFYALVDALAGREKSVEESLRRVPGLAGHAACRERNYDFLVKFDVESFDVVDDFLQTHVRRLPGVGGVEIITDWSDYSGAVEDARRKLG